ncbi:MAG: hypothetical protein V1738_04240 [Patescibacteria group bacterium]
MSNHPLKDTLIVAVLLLAVGIGFMLLQPKSTSTPDIKIIGDGANALPLEQQILDFKPRPNAEGITVFYESKYFIYLSHDGRSYPSIVQSLEPMYVRIAAAYELPPENELISVLVYPTQAAFWDNIFKNEPNDYYTTGKYDGEKSIMYIVDPADQSVRSEQDMINSMTHELVHLLFPNENVELLEGLAFYLSGEIYPFDLDSWPKPDETLEFYHGQGAAVRRAHNYAAWRVKFMTEVCLADDRPAFKDFYFSSTSDLDYSRLGFPDQPSFEVAFEQYLIKHSRVIK